VAQAAPRKQEGKQMFKSMTANLMVENVEDTIAFYGGKLGFTVINSVPGPKGGVQFAILGKDSLMLMCQERNNLGAEYPIIATEKVQPSITLFIMVDDFDEQYAHLKTVCELLHEEHVTFYGTREFAIADNNGYVLTFAEQK
jgi:uncharacterized glyoxalase superfamily protein PhnB